MNFLKGCRLTILRKNGKCTLFKPQSNCIKIGNDINSTIRLKTQNAKALHCKIIKNEDNIFIINYCKESPVKVNNEIVLNKAVLKNGDVIEILNIQMKWQHFKIKQQDSWTELVSRVSEKHIPVKFSTKKVFDTSIFITQKTGF